MLDLAHGPQTLSRHYDVSNDHTLTAVDPLVVQISIIRTNHPANYLPFLLSLGLNRKIDMAMFVQLLGDEGDLPRHSLGPKWAVGRQTTFPLNRHIAEETIPMKRIWHGHSTFRMGEGEAKILIDPFLSDSPSRDNGWSGCLTGKNSTQGGDR